jgi:hypothetical protein
MHMNWGKQAAVIEPPKVDVAGSLKRVVEQVRMPDMKLPEVNLSNLKMPEEVRLPDVTLPRVSMGEIRRQDMQLPDVTLPRLKMGDVAFKDVRLRGPRMGGLRALIRLAVVVAFGAAVIKEMSQPEDKRTWHGDVFGVPYDFRPPTADRFRAAWWNGEAGLFTETPWGIGWTVNFRRAIVILSQRLKARS